MRDQETSRTPISIDRTHFADMEQKSGNSVRKKKRALTIEDLFTSVSTVKAYNDFPAPPRYVLSPRSAEACLREGVDPEQLRIRDLDSFWEPGIDASRQGMRHEAYSERRHSIMKALRKARTSIINADAAKERRGGKQGSSIAAQMKAEEAKKESTMIEMEAKRLAKMQRRQQKEIEQLLAFEMKTAQIQEQAQRKLAEEMKRQERKKREVLRRQKIKAEEQRMKALKRQAEEELEEKKRRALANQQYLKEAQLKEKNGKTRYEQSSEKQKRNVCEKQKNVPGDCKNFKTTSRCCCGKISGNGGSGKGEESFLKKGKKKKEGNAKKTG